MERTKEAQEWIDRIIQNEVLACATDVVEFILRASQESRELYDDAPFTYDDVEYGHIDNSDCIEELEEKLDEINAIEPEEPEEKEGESEAEFDARYAAWEIAWNDWDDKREEIENEIDKLHDEEEETREIFEWWEVTNWLADDLQELGETVIKGWHNYWGRTCTGQAISMDSLMDDLYALHEARWKGLES